jgi:GTPase SAR1 family protein
MIAGNARNVGKTTLALALIQHYSELYPVIGLKVSSIYPNDDIHHGIHENEKPETFDIYQEFDRDGHKDTSKMLAAGAKKVFFVRSLDSHLKEAMTQFIALLPKNCIVVCESRSLRKVLIPGLLVLIRKEYDGFTSKSIEELVPLADLQIFSSHEKYSIADAMNAISFESGTWKTRLSSI